MPRPKSPEGKRITICAKITEDDAVIIDARCAVLGITRSAWMQSLIAASLVGVTDSGEVHGIRVTVDPEMSPGAVALASPGRRPVLMSALSSRDCPHRGLNPGAWCKTCQSVVPERKR